MKHHTAVVVLAALLTGCRGTPLWAQTIDASVCEVLAKPESYNGKTVRIQATVVAGLDEFAAVDPACKQKVNAIWLDYPEGTKAKAGPASILQLQLAKNSSGKGANDSSAHVILDKNKDFKDFDSLLSAPAKTSERCLGCVRASVTATLTGRLDAVAETGLEYDEKAQFTAVLGFGNLNRYKARLVIASVSGVTAHEIDYSKANALPKTDTDQGGGDPVAIAHEAAKVFGSNIAGVAIERAAAAFGGPGEDNGVDVGFGAGNEVPKGERQKGAGNSPDGLLFLTTFNMDRLKGRALSEAIVHTGALIADLRGGKSGESLYELQSTAWQVTILSSIANGEKSMTVPGGTILWESKWSPEERNSNFANGIHAYLTGWSALSR
jgi:hypothetical protein